MAVLLSVALAALAVLLECGSSAVAGEYPISGAWTVAPAKASQIAAVERACQAYRRKEDLAERASAGHLVVFASGTSTWYDSRGVRVCKNIAIRPAEEKSFHLVDSCRTGSQHQQKQERYSMKRLNRLQVFVTPEGAATYELIGCPG